MTRNRQSILQVGILLCLAAGMMACCCRMKRQEQSSKSVVSNREKSILPGFEISPHWNEQIRSFTVDPQAKVRINAPSPDKFDPKKPVRIILYTLPNGNTTEQTIGRRMSEGLDWHFDIQHIGAQTRRLRQLVTNENIVVAYLEAEPRSWPAWRGKYGADKRNIARLIESVTQPFAAYPTSINLSSHSGGGSFIFGVLNNVERIPDAINRIVFMDSNYAYSDEWNHGDKLIEWLGRSVTHHLVVIAYDDREITLNGKKVLGPTGGTYRATHRMLERFEKDYRLSKVEDGDLTVWTDPRHQVEFIIHHNPDNAILHTVLVERNGFIHSAVFGTKFERKAAPFYSDRDYEQWIQP